MEGRRKTKVQLISELAALRQQNATLKARESKQWGAEERESNGQKIHILESITDAFYALDQQWRFTYLNRPAERLLRRTREEVFGKNAWDEFPEANTAVTRQESPRAVAEQTRVNFEVFHPPFEKWFEVHACPSPKGLAVYFRDITGRKHTEKELRESEERFSKAFDANPALIALSSFATGRFIDANANFLQLMGYSREEVISHTAAELQFWVDPAVRTRLVEHCELGRPVAMSRLSIAAKRGNSRCAHLKRTHRAEQEPCVLSMFCDITERKRMEAALRRAKQLSDSLLENMPAGVALFDNNFVLCWYNPVYADLIRTYTPYRR